MDLQKLLFLLSVLQPRRRQPTPEETLLKAVFGEGAHPTTEGQGVSVEDVLLGAMGGGRHPLEDDTEPPQPQGLSDAIEEVIGALMRGGLPVKVVITFGNKPTDDDDPNPEPTIPVVPEREPEQPVQFDPIDRAVTDD